MLSNLNSLKLEMMYLRVFYILSHNKNKNKQIGREFRINSSKPCKYYQTALVRLPNFYFGSIQHSWGTWLPNCPCVCLKTRHSMLKVVFVGWWPPLQEGSQVVTVGAKQRGFPCTNCLLPRLLLELLGMHATLSIRLRFHCIDLLPWCYSSVFYNQYKSLKVDTVKSISFHE